MYLLGSTCFGTSTPGVASNLGEGRGQILCIAPVGGEELEEFAEAGSDGITSGM